MVRRLGLLLTLLGLLVVDCASAESKVSLFAKAFDECAVCEVYQTIVTHPELIGNVAEFAKEQCAQPTFSRYGRLCELGLKAVAGKLLTFSSGLDCTERCAHSPRRPLSRAVLCENLLPVYQRFDAEIDTFTLDKNAICALDEDKTACAANAEQKILLMRVLARRLAMRALRAVDRKTMCGVDSAKLPEKYKFTERDDSGTQSLECQICDLVRLMVHDLVTGSTYTAVGIQTAVLDAVSIICRLLGGSGSAGGTTTPGLTTYDLCREAIIKPVIDQLFLELDSLVYGPLESEFCSILLPNGNCVADDGGEAAAALFSKKTAANLH